MTKLVEKRTVDMEIIGDWVEPNTRVLDLGCGSGVLLDYLVQTKKVSAVGVDLELAKITACVRRGLAAYQGDMTDFMRAFPDKHFDRVICSRTVHGRHHRSAPRRPHPDGRLREPRLLEKPRRYTPARTKIAEPRLHHRVVREPSGQSGYNRRL